MARKKLFVVRHVLVWHEQRNACGECARLYTHPGSPLSDYEGGVYVASSAKGGWASHFTDAMLFSSRLVAAAFIKQKHPNIVDCTDVIEVLVSNE